MKQFDEIDVNKNGEIDRTELINYLMTKTALAEGKNVNALT